MRYTECDMCGLEIKGGYTLEINNNNPKSGVFMLNTYNAYDKETYDLCPDCYEKIKDVLNKK